MVFKLLVFCNCTTSNENWENVVNPPRTPVSTKTLIIEVLLCKITKNNPNKKDPNIPGFMKSISHHKLVFDSLKKIMNLEDYRKIKIT